MNFEKALKATRKGKKVKYCGNIYWLDRVENIIIYYCYDFDDDYLDDTTTYVAYLYGGDLMSEDWEVIND